MGILSIFKAARVKVNPELADRHPACLDCGEALEIGTHAYRSLPHLHEAINNKPKEGLICPACMRARVIQAVKELHRLGYSTKWVAQWLQVSVRTVQRLLGM